jgi:hypothetical protein
VAELLVGQTIVFCGLSFLACTGVEAQAQMLAYRPCPPRPVPSPGPAKSRLTDDKKRSSVPRGRK